MEQRGMRIHECGSGLWEWNVDVSKIRLYEPKRENKFSDCKEHNSNWGDH